MHAQACMELSMKHQPPFEICLPTNRRPGQVRD